MNHDHDSIEQTTSNETKTSKRERFKDALTRTKTKIDKFKEDRETRKNSEEKKSEAFQLSDDVNDFLSAGRVSAASTRPSIGSITSPEGEVSQPPAAPSIPPTTQPQWPPSPRRKPVPRIDVSVPSRFSGPQPGNDAQPPGSATLRPGSAGAPTGRTYLDPDFRPRSQSAIAQGISETRRARIRGLSVGFADASPVVIGEGGDECEMPVTEISKIRERARSASPGGRRPYPEKNAQYGAAGQGMRTLEEYDFVPKPLARTQTGFSSLDEGYEPSPIRRFPTQPLTAQQLSGSNNYAPLQLTRMGTGGLELQKEFEMTLGISPSTPSSAGSYATIPKPPMQIVAPKPRHPPPSYQIIENGQVNDPLKEPTLPSVQPRLETRIQTQTQPQPSRQVPDQPQLPYQQSRFRDPEQRAPPMPTQQVYSPPVFPPQHSQPSPDQQHYRYPQSAHPSSYPNLPPTFPSESARSTVSQPLHQPGDSYMSWRPPFQPGSALGNTQPDSKDEMYGANSLHQNNLSDSQPDSPPVPHDGPRHETRERSQAEDMSFRESPPLHRPPHQLRRKDQPLPSQWDFPSSEQNMSEQSMRHILPEEQQSRLQQQQQTFTTQLASGRPMRFYDQAEGPGFGRVPDGSM